MKKLLLFAATLITAFTLVGCSSQSATPTSIFDSKDDMIGFSALSSVMTLHEGVASNTTLSNDAQLEKMVTNDTFEILSEIEELTPYLDLVTTFMGNGSNFEATVEPSNLEGYEEMMTITTINMEGEEVSYTMHYNETIYMDEEDEEDEEIDEDEYDSTLEGIMIIEDVTYTLLGEREVEENEQSLELIATLDESNYVTLEYGMETEENESETEFSYEMYVNDELTKSVEIEFEEDNEETELSLTFIRGNRESTYDFEVETDGDTRTVEIQYTIVEDGNTIEEGQAEVTIVYNAETGETVVRYEIQSEGEEITYDDEDDDEDEEQSSDFEQTNEETTV